MPLYVAKYCGEITCSKVHVGMKVSQHSPLRAMTTSSDGNLAHIRVREVDITEVVLRRYFHKVDVDWLDAIEATGSKWPDLRSSTDRDWHSATCKEMLTSPPPPELTSYSMPSSHVRCQECVARQRRDDE